MLKLNRNLILVIPLVIAVIINYKVSAESDSNDMQNRRSEFKAEGYSDNKPNKMPPLNLEKFNEKRCEIITKRIDDKLNNFNENHFKHKNLHNNIREKLNRIITLAKEKNLDVSKLEEDLQTLDAKIKVFNDAYLTYIDKLKTTKDYVCGNSEGEFIKKVVDASQELKTIRIASQDIKDFFQNTLKQDIKDLRNQISETEE
jgi:hypothetical protein